MPALCQTVGYALEIQAKYEILILKDSSLWHGIETVGWEGNRKGGLSRVNAVMWHPVPLLESKDLFSQMLDILSVP